MFHVYETLASDVTSDYAGNVASKFKVKLGLKLPGTQWKVSILSAVLPKMTLFKSMQGTGVNLMELWAKTEHASKADKWEKGFVKASDLKAWETSESCGTAEEFFNCVKHRLEETAHAELDADYKIDPARWIHLEWDKKGAQPELVIKKTTENNIIRVYKPFADLLRWTTKTNKVDDLLGENLVHLYADHTKTTSTLNNGKEMVLHGKWVDLNTLANWRFINLKQSFQDAGNLHARPLTVTAKVTAGSATITQPLGRVYYSPQGRERYLFTPPVEEVHHLETTRWDEVEITLTELDGTEVQFQADSQCVLRLHLTLEE